MANILNLEMILSGTTLKRTKKEALKAYLARISHLAVSNNLHQLCDLTSLSSLTVLYLYDNQLKTISGLKACPITRLYLQNNNLTSFQGIDGIKTLCILNVSGNYIQNALFHDLPNLESMAIDKQKVKGLVFDVESCRLAECLTRLTATHNGIENISWYSHFPALEYLDLSNNASFSTAVNLFDYRMLQK